MHIGSASSSIADQRRRISLYRSRLGFRRRSGGAMQSTVLWGCMLVGLAARVVLRYVMTAFWRRSVGRQTVSADWELLRALARCDPLARWAVA
jgi:hypothetical protein